MRFQQRQTMPQAPWNLSRPAQPPAGLRMNGSQTLVPPRCRLVTTLAEAAEIDLTDADVWDYETTGLYWWSDECYALAALVDDVPFVFVGEALRYARTALARNIGDPDRTVIAYNAKFELHFTSRDVLPVRAQIIDPSLALFLVDENRFSGAGHGLKDAVKQLFGYTMTDFKKMLGRVTEETGEYKTRKCTACAGRGWRGRDHSQCDGCAGVGTEARPVTRNRLRLIGEVPIEEMAQYAGEDVWWTKRVWEWADARLRANPELERNFREVQMPLLRTLYDGEHRGIRVDIEAASELRESYLSKIAAIDAEVRVRTGVAVEGATSLRDDEDDDATEDAGGGGEQDSGEAVRETVNLGSPAQVDWFLYKHQKLRRPPFRSKRKAKDGSRVASKWQTDENCLLWIAKHSGDPVAKLIWNRRKYAKYVGTYLDNIIEWATEESPGVWVLYPNFNQTAARTGRLSSSKPMNFQNVPRLDVFRSLFIARPGCVLVIADAKQIELRFLAHYSNEPVLVGAYSDPKRDLHQETADMLELDGKEGRYVGKTANFAEVYEVYGNTFSMQLFRDTEGMVDWTKEQAQEVLDRIRASRPMVKRWKLNVVQYLKAHGFVTTIENRRRRLKDVNDQNWGKAKYAERQGINAKIQGSVGDLFARELGKECYVGPFRLQVHDEIVSEVPRGVSEAFAVTVRVSIESFTELYKMRVPILAEVAVGSDWSAK